jgi:hypothetical protein
VADIFISHSSKDNEVAAELGERIKHERPTWSLFYDKDNFRAGQRWQERLRKELTSCRVVLVLLSRNWLGSPWCFTEAVTASFRGKDVVGIETEDLTSADLARAPPILHERQRDVGMTLARCRCEVRWSVRGSKSSNSARFALLIFTKRTGRQPRKKVAQ